MEEEFNDVGPEKHAASTCKSVDTTNKKHTHDVSHLQSTEACSDCKPLLKVSREVLNIDFILCALKPSFLHTVLHTVAEVDQ